MPELPSKESSLSGWGRSLTGPCLTFRPERTRDVDHFMQDPPSHWIARGQGRSYGDAALFPDGLLLSERMNRVQAFDEATGRLTAESGMTLADVLTTFLPRGWLPPVMPGTKRVSLGGCFASNIHGKNHYKIGDFAEHVTAIQLRTADGNTITATPDGKHKDAFWATAGGMGLTGYIESLTLQLTPCPNIALDAEGQYMPNLDAMLYAMKSSIADWDYMVGWINHFKGGDQLGSGYVERARFADTKTHTQPCHTYRPRRPWIAIPKRMPGCFLNRLGMSLYNQRRQQKHPEDWKAYQPAFEDFFFPLDDIAHWNRLYGKNGLVQYQCILPDHPGVAGHLRQLLQIPHRDRRVAYLAVLKYHRDSPAPMGFPMRGFSLALDFPMEGQRTIAMIDTMDSFVTTLGGRIYLAKDAVTHPEALQMMYAHALPGWRKTLDALDPEHRMQSLLNLRTKLRPLPQKEARHD
jgi:decaprenylphospho-beta-D-ribofuranose 2-oxidase